MKLLDIFLTIQGEGRSSGLLTIFIRTAFCPVECKWCDTGFAHEDRKEAKYNLTPNGIMKFLKEKEWKAKYICLTGGEPLLEKETRELVDLLTEAGWVVVIETSGVVKFTEYLSNPYVSIVADIKCPSSGEAAKKNRVGDWLLLRQGVDQLKAVVSDRIDYEFAKEMLEKYKPKCEVLMSPCWIPEKGAVIAPELASWIIEDQLSVRFQLQVHKYSGVA